MLAAYWRGEITLRKLRVYIENLDPDSAPYRTQTDGEKWTWTEWLLWQMLFMLEWVGVRIARSNGDSRAKMNRDKPLEYPWSEDTNVERYGDRGDLTPAQAKAILDAL